MLNLVKHLLILSHILAALIILSRGSIQPKISMYGKTLLMVTAHPDDEAMFFGPTINHAREQEASIYLLCLSDGGSEGLGSVRGAELAQAAHILGIYPYNVSIVNIPELPDSMTETWDINAIMPILTEFVEAVQPDVILSFDDYGVSGHTNHIQTSKAVREWVKQNPGPSAWLLRSVPIWRKFISAIDVIPVILKNGFRSLYFVNGVEGHFREFAAMTQGHKSQMKWFRYLWLLFSRYTYVNDYEMVMHRPMSLAVEKMNAKIAAAQASSAAAALSATAAAAHGEL